VQQFTDMPGRNAMLLAYGQTGTGKTHTIFGAAEAAVTDEREEEWGIFPKVVNLTLQTMKAKGAFFKLTLSATEFYLGQCFDLLNKKAPVGIDSKELGPRMSTQVQITEISELKGILETIFKERTARATKMNLANTGHTGSSRSHAALILTLD
jgi:hypothetical protein